MPINLPAYPSAPKAQKASGPVVRVDPFLDRVNRPHGGTLTVYDMTMGNVVFDPQIATVLEQATASELEASGFTVVRGWEPASQGAPMPAFVVTGAIDEFVVSSPTSLVDWDVRLDMRVSFGLFRADGSAVRSITPAAALMNEKTMLHPGQDIKIGRAHV